jgi:hypothetical protein
MESKHMTQHRPLVSPVRTGMVVAASFVLGLVWGAGRGESVAQPPTQSVSPEPAAPVQTPAPPPGAATPPSPDSTVSPGPSTVTGRTSGIPGAVSPLGAVDPLEPPSRETARLFTADHGLILSFLKPGQNTAFERTMKRVFEAMAISPDNERRRQALGWKLYKAEDPLDGGVLLYISVFDPTVPGMDYWVPEILNEAFPTEVQELYETYAGAFADGQTLQNLTLLYPSPDGVGGVQE